MGYQGMAGQYKRMNIETAGRVDLILMCYEKSIEMLRHAKLCLEGKEYEKKAAKMQKAIEIIHHLKGCLNFEQGGQIARNLDAIYSYAVRRLLEGDVKKDLAAFDEVIRILSELKEAWDGVARSEAKETATLGGEARRSTNLQQIAA
ncbi:MAG: flagellar export chaperone FliS [Desulfobacteraceae bacterium]|nr:MAG: flagellar export chaperone FliS [Desulfobacteraceae bacterium]